MKTKNKKRINRYSLWAVWLISGLALLFTTCKELEDEPMKYVDLRYRVDNGYVVDSIDASPVVFQVKSLYDPWEVYSINPDWCTISPNSGSAGETHDVQVEYEDNLDLDDRIDTLVIKSDYWIGKRVQVRQKGLAFLKLAGHEDFLLESGADSRNFEVESNQDWSVAVTEGNEWLSITSGETGSMNGTVTVSTKENKGAKRYGTVTIFDRHGAACCELICTQDGLQLDPAEFLIKIPEPGESTYTLQVVSNADWVVTKDNEYIGWYSFPTTEFNGTNNLIINISQNSGTDVRSATFTLSTKYVEGIEPVTHTITIKQGPQQIPTRYEFDENERLKWTVNQGDPLFESGDVTFDATGGGCRIIRNNMSPGKYTYKIKSASSNAILHSFYYSSVGGTWEVRWHFNIVGGLGSTHSSSAPTGTFSPSGSITGIDFSVPHEWTMNITKGSYDEEKGHYLRNYEYILDGNHFATLKDFGPYESPIRLYVGAREGVLVVDWWEYTPPIEWGDD